VLSAELGAEVWLKLECQQRTGSFKLRGALNRLLTLPEEARASGVLTCSAGNHGLGLAEAARLTGIAATIVVPENASPAKVAGLRRSGVELLLIGKDYDEAEARAPEIARARGLTFVSPYDDPAVIAGAGTVALETLLALPEAGTIVVPVGGGGLAAGIGVVARAINPALRVIGVQSEASAAMTASLIAGELVPVESGPTLADGLAGNIAPGSITFPLVRDHLDDVITVSETAIAAAMLTFLDRHHLVVEGSGAVGLAALRENKLTATPAPIVLIVSGGNVATTVLAGLLRDAVAS
jgi:threonine dehydratase